MEKGTETDPKRRERVAMLVALPQDLWNRIRAEARDLGIGPSRLIEPVLLQAFDCGPISFSEDPAADLDRQS